MTITTIKRGDSVAHAVTFNYVTGVPADLSTATITAALVATLDGVEVAALEIDETDLAVGEFSIVISPAITEALSNGRTYYYDALIVHDDFTAHTETYGLKIEGRATGPSP